MGPVFTSPSTDTVRDLDTIQNILHFTKGEGLILALDSKASSILWFDKHTNVRGRTMEEYKITMDIHIINTETGMQCVCVCVCV